MNYRSIKIDSDEILVKGKTLFKGYVHGNVTTLPVDEGGWFRTGDLGRLDSEGYLTFLGRKDNMFISGGENIHPEEIEDLLCLLPEVSEAVVVPIEDREFGFRPLAFIRTHEGKEVDKQSLILRLESDLPRFKLPVGLYEWPERADGGQVKPDRQYLTRLARELQKE